MRLLKKKKKPPQSVSLRLTNSKVTHLEITAEALVEMLVDTGGGPYKVTSATALPNYEDEGRTQFFVTIKQEELEQTQ